MKLYVQLIIISIAFYACNPTPKKKVENTTPPKYTLHQNSDALVNIKTFNHYNQQISQGFGFYIAPKQVLANLSLIKGAFRVKIAPMATNEYSDIEGYLAFDHTTNLVIMQSFISGKSTLEANSNPNSTDSVYSLFRTNRKLFVRKTPYQKPIEIDSILCVPLSNDYSEGEAIFTTAHQLIGIAQTRKIHDSSQLLALAVNEIQKLQIKIVDLKSIFDLSTKSSRTYPSFTKIKGFRILTSMGQIDLKLYNETPQYRDNFIRLVCDGFYDSLLIHRVIKGFLIQTGAADTKHAKKDDVVGWEGPGYTLPLSISPNLFHKRGAIAASKLPADRNAHNRCDGSQFYIVAGRAFTNDELSDLEKHKNKHFSPEQRTVYTTIGGAPYLDSDYTVLEK